MPETNPTPPESLTLEPGTLWVKVTERTQQALECGALQSIPTDSQFVEDGGIRFLVRSLSNLARKDKAKQQQEKQRAKTAKPVNPFLPYDEDLFVADISETHVCLLNKFNVVDYHLLLVTREFESQENWLNLQDFAAMWRCLDEFEGLAFYNGGTLAGASQPHKHLQLVPIPLTGEGPKIPIETAIASATFSDGVGTSSQLPFHHAIARFDRQSADSPLQAAESALQLYNRLLRAVGWEPQTPDNRQSGAYNLLATRHWMLLVPRSQECFEAISVNALGFAGSLFVRNQAQMQHLTQIGPMRVLQQVARSHSSTESSRG